MEDLTLIDKWNIDSEIGIEVEEGVNKENYKRRFAEAKSKYGLNALSKDLDLKDFLNNHPELLKELK